MSSTTDIGRLGEAAVYKALVLDGWFVFTDPSGKCSVDMIAWKDGAARTIQVKTTGYSVGNKWLVQLKSVRPNRTGNTIKHFDNSAIDILAIYIVPEDRVLLLDSSFITQKTQLSIDVL